LCNNASIDFYQETDMNTQPDRKTARLATTSLILGILSLGLVVVGLILILRVRLPGGPTDDASRLSLGFLAVFLMLGSLAVGIPGFLTGSIARRRNTAEGNDPQIQKTATTGRNLSIIGISIVVVLFAYALIFAPKIPPSDISTPIPSTALP
jgi:heme/copper-type cytochrome/quinol oxidase subunit 2